MNYTHEGPMECFHCGQNPARDGDVICHDCARKLGVDKVSDGIVGGLAIVGVAAIVAAVLWLIVTLVG